MQTFFGNESTARAIPVGLVLGAAFLSLQLGCAPAVPPNYTAREAGSTVYPEHVEEIKVYLKQYFGDPLRPRMMVGKVVEPGEEGAAATDAAASSSSSAAPADATPAGEATTKIALTERVDANRLRHGQLLYQANCAVCHGITGDGNGESAAYLNPKPRDYRLGRFKFISTPRGEKPRRIDLERVIRYGAKGTSMPEFRWLSVEDIEPLMDYVMLLACRGELEVKLLAEAENELDEGQKFDPAIVADYAQQVYDSWDAAPTMVVLPISQRPAYTDESILAGRAAFLSRGCAKCHGNDGRGTKEDVGKDDWGQTAYAADLSAGMLHGGRRPIDIYRRIYAGINGTPMPAFAGAVSDSPDTIWHLVHYILSIVEGRQVPGIENVQPLPEATTTDTSSGDTSATPASEASSSNSANGEATAAPAASESSSAETTASEPSSADDNTASGTAAPPVEAVESSTPAATPDAPAENPTGESGSAGSE